jgi:3-phenylpropionate/cinnamic acid dioxygenase small subunit
MIGYLRKLCLYPNLFLLDRFSSQLRVFRPISVDQTEVTIDCIAPKGESQEARTLTEDPANEMSLIYYPDRGGIGDRVFRIKTDRSSATSLPQPRTSHDLSNVEVLSRDGSRVHLRFNWMTHNYRYGTTDTCWGATFNTVDAANVAPLITSKKVILKNDRIHHVTDVSHI